MVVSGMWAHVDLTCTAVITPEHTLCTRTHTTRTRTTLCLQLHNIGGRRCGEVAGSASSRSVQSFPSPRSSDIERVEAIASRFRPVPGLEGEGSEVTPPPLPPFPLPHVCLCPARVCRHTYESCSEGDDGSSVVDDGSVERGGGRMALWCEQKSTGGGWRVRLEIIQPWGTKAVH